MAWVVLACGYLVLKNLDGLSGEPALCGFGWLAWL
jgi:hypothetical protein